MILDHQAEDRQQPVCQGVPRLHPAVGDGEGDGGGHDGVQNPQEQRSTKEQHNKFNNHSICTVPHREPCRLSCLCLIKKYGY